MQRVYMALCSVAVAVFAPMTEVEARTVASSALDRDAQGSSDDPQARTLALLDELSRERAQQMVEASARYAETLRSRSPRPSPKASSNALLLTIPRLVIEDQAVKPRVHASRWPRSSRVELATADHEKLNLVQASAAREPRLGAASGFDVPRRRDAEIPRHDPRLLLGASSTWSLVTGTFPLGVSGVQIVARPNGHGANIRARGTF